MGNKTGQVFISYSHDNAEHANRVLELSNKLRNEGIDCLIDQYEESPPEGWPRWMDKKIRDASYVLMICTEAYYKRVMGEEEPGKGLGVRWEGSLIYNHFYSSGAESTKFIPILFDASHKDFIPTPIKGLTYYCIDNTKDYDDLYYRLIDRAKTEKPQIGDKRPLPQKIVKTVFSDIIEKEYIYQGLKCLIENGDGTGFHNADLGHPVYRVGASDASLETLKSLENADSPKKNPLFKMLSKLSKELKHSGIEDMRFVWWYDFSEWKDFCKFVTSVYDKKRKAQES